MSSWGFLFVGHVWKTFKERRPGCFLNRCRNELLNPFLNLYLRQTPATLRMKLILVNPSFHFLNLPEVTLGRYIHWYIKIFAFQLSSLISTILQYNTCITLCPPPPKDQDFVSVTVKPAALLAFPQRIAKLPQYRVLCVTVILGAVFNELQNLVWKMQTGTPSWSKTGEGNSLASA